MFLNFKKAIILLVIVWIIFFLSGLLITSRSEIELSKNSRDLNNNFFHNFKIITSQNSKVWLIILSGVLLLGFSSLFQIVYIALNFGMITGLLTQKLTYIKYISMTAPHGILEMASFLIVAAYSFIIAEKFIRKLIFEEDICIKSYFYKIKKKILMSYFLLLIAGAIEAGLILFTVS